jgi:hypothetical protein
MNEAQYIIFVLIFLRTLSHLEFVLCVALFFTIRLLWTEPAYIAATHNTEPFNLVLLALFGVFT